MDSLRLLTRGSGIKGSHHASKAQPTSRAAQNGRAEPDAITQVSKKRKWAEIESQTADKENLTQDEIRRIQKLCNIKITDLKVLHKSKGDDSRKAQKEASRLFPQPLQSFSALDHKDLNHALLSNLAEQGYKEPSEVQMATIPLLLATNEASTPNLLTVAPTGSGKTLAFMIPLIDRIAKQHKISPKGDRHIAAVILAPTRELVVQIVNEGRKLSQRTGVHITEFRKGMLLSASSIPQREDHIREDSDSSEASHDSNSYRHSRGTVVKADIIVATPLALAHALPSTDLPQIQYLVLDEADVLLDALFREQTLSIWSACTNPSLRSSLWSATIGSSIEELAIDIIRTRQRKCKVKPSPPLLRCIIGLKDTSLPNIAHKLIYASTEAGKLTGLRQIIRPPPSTSSSDQNDPNAIPRLTPPFLVFCQTIERATALYEELKYDLPLLQATSNDAHAHPIPRIALLHASLTSSQRSTTMQNFRLGKIWILITTDLLSRGIDFRGVNGVINYDIPTTSASYVHRAGRTGRAGKSGGTCITLYTRDDVKYLRPIANVITKSKKAFDSNSHGDKQRRTEGEGEGHEEDAIPAWLLASLPELTKNTKKELKQRGVDVRRGVKQSDDKEARRIKARNKIGTKSGYEKREENNRRGMVEGSKRRRKREDEQAETTGDGDGKGGEEFGGFD